MPLKKELHPNHDFFIADVFDNTPFKDDMASMEHPIFVLSKNISMRNLEYRKDNISVTIKPSTDGLPTIFDKDILLYCGSLMMREVNAGRTPSRTLRVSCHDLLVATNRGIDGDAYTRLKHALDRLQGVSIKTNIKTNRHEITRAFGVLDSYEVIESSRIKDRMIRLEITVSEWFYNSFVGKEVLTISRDYFRLGKPIERRVYEIARKHCGAQASWSIGLANLMEKTGSTDTLRKFRLRLKEIANDDNLPDYSFTVADDDKVTFTKRKDAPAHHAPQAQGLLALQDMPRLSPPTIEKARALTREAGTGWDFYGLQADFLDTVHSGKFNPKNINGAFINFIKKKVEKRP
jgi:plasmid replication initiation protein